MGQLEAVLHQLATSYDAFPYFSNAFKWCAPGHLRAVAYLYGLNAPPVASARILEIGCAAGGNCLPAAFLYPDAHIVGVDISEVQIREGQGVIARAGLSNIALHAMSFTDIPDAWGTFDYIIAHGVFSWVPPTLQRELLHACQRLLSPQGIAYISFNTYPGWKAHELLRDWMMWHTEPAVCYQERIEQARDLLPFIQEGLAVQNPLAPVLQQLAQQVPASAQNDYYLAHEYLEMHNHPLYFKDFCALAQQYGLAFVGEADAKEDLAQTYGLTTNARFQRLTQHKSRLEQLQYLDYAVGRTFRKSLLTHQTSCPTPVAPDLSRVADLRLAGWFTWQLLADGGYAVTSALSGQFILRDARLLPLLDLLTQSWPRPVAGRDVMDYALQQGATDPLYLLQQLFLQVPVEINRSYEDLPYCLQDYYTGLVPGVGQIIADRQQHLSQMSEWNAWYSSSTERFSTAELFVIDRLHQGYSPLRTATALAQAWHMGQLPADAVLPADPEQAADDLVDEVIARLRKYAMYV